MGYYVSLECPTRRFVIHVLGILETFHPAPTKVFLDAWPNLPWKFPLPCPRPLDNNPLPLGTNTCPQIFPLSHKQRNVLKGFLFFLSLWPDGLTFLEGLLVIFRTLDCFFGFIERSSFFYKIVLLPRRLLP